MIKPTSTAAPGPIPTVVPSPIYQTSTQHGQRTLWVVFALMLLSTGLFSLMSWNVPVSRRLFYVLSTLTTLVASLSYFALASGDAITFNCEYVHEHNRHAPDMSHDVCRQVYWARYVDWAITAPLLLVQLSLLAGIDGAHTLMAVVANLVMVLSGLFAALGDAHTAQKWGWYTISCISYVFVLWHVALHGSKAVSAKGRGLSRLFASLSLFALGLWTAYPIVWGIAGGARKTSVDTEIMVYAVLDILAKPIFGLWLLFSQRKVAESNVEVTGYWSHGPAGEGRIRIGEDE